MKNDLISSPKSVIWIASYPKSGNTWVQSVVQVAGKSYGFPKKDLDVYKMIRESRGPDVVGGIRSDVCPDAATVLKTHDKYTVDQSIHPVLKLQTAGFVYVIRNPLDMLLSYINFTRIQYAKNKENKSYQDDLFIGLLGFDKAIPYEEWVLMTLDTIPQFNLDHALNYFTEFETFIPNMKMTGGSWIDHVFSWYDARNSIPSVFLRYEDLLQGLEYFMSIKNIFSFSRHEISEAVEVVNNVMHGHGRQSKNIFYNKMTSYYYLEYFSNDLIIKFLKKYEDELNILGYRSLPKATLIN